MEFKLNYNKSISQPITSQVCIPVSEDMKKKVDLMKSANLRNRKLVNELTRQFLSQLIEKFEGGEFESESA